MGTNLVNVKLVTPVGRHGYLIKNDIYLSLRQTYNLHSTREIGREDYPLKLFLGVELNTRDLVSLGMLTPFTHNALNELGNIDLGAIKRIAAGIPPDKMHSSDNADDINLKAEIFLRRLLVKECFAPIEK